jgi:hypothetical protein
MKIYGGVKGQLHCKVILGTEGCVNVSALTPILITTKRMQFSTHYDNVTFEVFTAVTMKNGIFRDVTPCDSKNRRFGGT